MYMHAISTPKPKTRRRNGHQTRSESVLEFAPAKCDVIVDFAGFGKTTADALEAVAPGGKVVVVGMGRLESTINTRSLILKEAQLVGSCGGTAQDIKEVYGYFATGKLKPKLHEISFDEIPEGLERLRRGEVKGRLVAVR